MNDIIHLLPDSVANQIAAGEVIQRPASVVKELVENALDAGATDIQLIFKDAGRTLIQVIDNGKGMSATDARLAFERHATSKIKSADDLFALNTMGFRGEALASIAAVAHVELKTRRTQDDVGTFISIASSTVEAQTSVACGVGCNFAVKNIFFNVPARRKFLKSNQVEWKNILTEFDRIALVYPEISFRVTHNDALVYDLPPATVRQRIVSVMGKNFNNHLIPIDVDTSLVSISGFVGNPESAKKSGVAQFFFVNGRYMRHPFFHKAVMQAYERLLPTGEMSPYFLYFKVDPSTIDVNIHPTKTEIKFENELPVWQIIVAAVKESLGKHNAVPSIDFDTVDAPDIPVYNSASNPALQPPKVNFNNDYNPFKSAGTSSYRPKQISSDWDKLYQNFEKKEVVEPDEEVLPVSPVAVQPSFVPEEPVDGSIFSAGNPGSENGRYLLQLKGRYILTSAKSGLMIIDQRRAHIRILYDAALSNIQSGKGASQGVLFPEMIQLTPAEAAILPLLDEDLALLGFDLSDLGQGCYSVNATPAGLENQNIPRLLHNMLYSTIEKGCDAKEEIHHILALSLAESTAVNYGKTLIENEMQQLIDQLFSCIDHSNTPDGKCIIQILSNEELEKRFR